MTHYQEITLLDGKTSPFEVWDTLYSKLHIALVDVKNKHGIEGIGVSFPDYHYHVKQVEQEDGSTVDREFGFLGARLRVFGPNQEALDLLDLKSVLGGMNNALTVSNIDVVPDVVEHITVHRYQRKSEEKQAKSLAKKLGITYDEAMTTVKKREFIKGLPFIKMKSHSNQNNFYLKILQKYSNQEVVGDFNTYGLNGMRDNTTVPHW